MKFIHKRHTAIVVDGNAEGTLDLQIVTPDDNLELKGNDGKPMVIVNEEISREEIEVRNQDIPTEINRLSNDCMIENTKFKKVALYGAKLGDIVTVKVKYLAE